MKSGMSEREGRETKNILSERDKENKDIHLRAK